MFQSFPKHPCRICMGSSVPVYLCFQMLLFLQMCSNPWQSRGSALSACPSYGWGCPWRLPQPSTKLNSLWHMAELWDQLLPVYGACTGDRSLLCLSSPDMVAVLELMGHTFFYVFSAMKGVPCYICHSRVLFTNRSNSVPSSATGKATDKDLEANMHTICGRRITFGHQLLVYTVTSRLRKHTHWAQRDAKLSFNDLFLGTMVLWKTHHMSH